MEASKVMGRSLRLAASRLRECECSSTSSPRLSLAIPLRQRSLPNRPFSTSTRRRASNVKGPSPSDTAVASAPTQAAPSPKLELQNYTNSLQKVIDGYKLESKLSARQYASFTAAVRNARLRLDAADAHPESFAPLLRSLHGEVEPVLLATLRSYDLTRLLADLKQQKSQISSSSVSDAGSSTPLAESDAEKGRMSSQLDDIMGKRKSSPPVKTPPRAESDTTNTLDALLQYYATKPDAADTSYRERSQLVQDRVNLLELGSRRTQSKHAVTGPALRLKASLGRTVEVRGDLTRAWRTLESMCARNQVKKDMQKQRFHVRRGQRKKDLKMQRWRTMFKEGFLAECERVRRMRRQGW